MATQNQGKGLGGGFLTFSLASPSMRLTSVRPARIVSACSNLRTASFQSSVKKSCSPANQTGLNFPKSLILTAVSLTKSFTPCAGMMKLKPCTMLPSGPGASDTKVRTPSSSARELITGPPELPHAAGASVWMYGLFALSCLKPDTAPFVTEASTLAD